MAPICETVTATCMRDLRERRDRSMADMVELRLDGVADADVAGAVGGRRTPVILTCRAAWEGGRFDGSEEERLRLLAQALASDADYVDLEWRAERGGLPARAADRVVLSHHDFSGTPDDVGDRIGAMRSAAPQSIVKLACQANTAADLIRLRDAGLSSRGRHVVIAMGAQGALSRACPRLFESEWSYGGQAAPGQTSVADLIDLYRVRSQSSSTRLFAITGKPLGHSASPAMHNAAFASLGIDAVYVPVEAEDPRAFLDLAAAFGIEGASITAPLKTGWPDAGVDVDAIAGAVGAANTLRHENGQWRAANFDVDGFLAPLRTQGIALRGARCVVLGAGGAARSAVWALRREGADVEVSSRRRERADALAASLGAVATMWPPPAGWDLLVNATPVGTWPRTDDSPIEQRDVQGAVVYDLVYHPRETRLLAWARAAGARTISGLDMLVAQAARQFEYWMGRSAPADVMRAAAERFLDGHAQS